MSTDFNVFADPVSEIVNLMLFRWYLALGSYLVKNITSMGTWIVLRRLSELEGETRAKESSFGSGKNYLVLETMMGRERISEQVRRCLGSRWIRCLRRWWNSREKSLIFVKTPFTTVLKRFFMLEALKGGRRAAIS